MIVFLSLGVIGLLCVYAEFFLPGGVLAVLGALSLIGSVAFFSFQVEFFGWVFAYALLLMVLSGFVCYLAIEHIRRSGKRNAFFLGRDQEGFSVDKLDESLVGKEGIVVTELKPAGHIRVEGEVYQALSQGGFVERGETVEVLQVKGSHVVVKINL